MAYFEVNNGEQITSITPSNGSPASLTANNAVKPTASGYAIASYDSVTPSSTATSVSSGDIVKIGGSGVIVDAIPTPTSITPSNTPPVALTANTAVKPTANGYAIESYSWKTPSDTTPPSVALGDIVKTGGAGYLYESEQSLKNLYRNKVLNGGYTSICSLSAFQSRVTINEGGMVADTVNHRVYLYVDFTANADVGSASDYAGLMLLNNISTDYYPKYSANNRNNTMPIITDETSANVLRQFYFGYNTSSYANRICLSYGSGANAIRTGDRYIIYAAYTYQ